MIETSSEQINHQNHDHDHDSITYKELKKYQTEKLENKFISAKFIITIYFHEVQKY